MKRASQENWTDLGMKLRAIYQSTSALAQHPAIVAGGCKRADRMYKASYTINRLRARLDREMCAEYPGWAQNVFYGSGGIE